MLEKSTLSSLSPCISGASKSHHGNSVCLWSVSTLAGTCHGAVQRMCREEEEASLQLSCGRAGRGRVTTLFRVALLVGKGVGGMVFVGLSVKSYDCSVTITEFTLKSSSISLYLLPILMEIPLYMVLKQNQTIRCFTIFGGGPLHFEQSPPISDSPFGTKGSPWPHHLPCPPALCEL